MSTSLEDDIPEVLDAWTDSRGTFLQALMTQHSKEVDSLLWEVAPTAIPGQSLIKVVGKSQTDGELRFTLSDEAEKYKDKLANAVYARWNTSAVLEWGWADVPSYTARGQQLEIHTGQALIIAVHVGAGDLTRLSRTLGSWCRLMALATLLAGALLLLYLMVTPVVVRQGGTAMVPVPFPTAPTHGEVPHHVNPPPLGITAMERLRQGGLRPKPHDEGA